MSGAMDDDAAGGFDPVAVFGEAGVGAHGAKDRGAGDGDRFDLLDDGIEDAAEAGSAEAGETGGLGVPVEADAMGQSVVADDLVGAAPVEEVGVDGGAVFVVANGAFTGVAGRVGARDLAAAGAEDLDEFHFGTPLFFAVPPGCGRVGCVREPGI